MSSIKLTLEDFSARGESVRALISDFRAGRMTAATLVTGAPGIGKKTLIGLMAKALLCVGEGDKPCGECRACRRFDARTHPDLLIPSLAPKEKTIKIEPIRGILNTLSRHAFEGGKRAVLLENAERMTPQAQNCLLKSLEEADESTYFLLSADQETAVLPTIRSRCRVIRMQPMTDVQVRRELLRAGYPEADARRVSLLSEGSMGQALYLLSDSEDSKIRTMVMDNFFRIASKKDIPSAEFRLKDAKDDFDRILADYEQELRLLLRERAGLAGESGEFGPLWRDAPVASVARLIQAAMETRKMRAANVNWQAALDGLLETIAEEVTLWQR